MRLTSGERQFLTSASSSWIVTEGRVEVYAVSGREDSWRQMFLGEFAEDGRIFPDAGEFGSVRFMVYAAENAELTEKSFDDDSFETLRAAMEEWLYTLSEVQWIRLLADRGDDVLVRWKKWTALSSCDDKPSLEAEFADNVDILSMLLEVRFKSEDKKWLLNVKNQEKRKKRLTEESYDALLGEAQERLEEEEVTGGASEVIYAVRRAAAAQHMPVDNISVTPEIAKRLDKLALLRRLVQKGNMQIRKLILEEGWYKKDAGVMLGLWGEKRKPAAFVPESPSSYRVFTKDNPDGELITADNVKNAGETAYACYAGLPGRKLGFKDVISFALTRCWEKDKKFLLAATCIAGLIPLLVPIITETLFSDIIPVKNEKGLLSIALVMAVASLSMGLITFARNVALLRISIRSEMTLDAALWNRILWQPASFFKKISSGNLARRMIEFSSLSHLLNGSFTRAVLDAIFSVLSLLVMAWYSPRLTLVAIVLWFFYFLVMRKILKQFTAARIGMVEAANRTAGIVQQIFPSLACFRTNGAEEQAFYLWSREFGDRWKYQEEGINLDDETKVLNTIMPVIMTTALFWAMHYFSVGEGSSGNFLPLPQFLAFMSANAIVCSSLVGLGSSMVEFCAALPYLRNISPLLESAPENKDDKPDAEPLSGSIEVKSLSFAYGPDLPLVLDNVSFSVSSGESLAIVGTSGSGKSTLIRLLLGFEKPLQGAIFYDGQDLADLSLPSVRSQMGIVLQEGKLMTGDILTNILGMTSLTEEDAWKAAEAAGIADDIRQMPLRMRTQVSEGAGNISGGQKQRILIARALGRGRPSW